MYSAYRALVSRLGRACAQLDAARSSRTGTTRSCSRASWRSSLGALGVMRRDGSRRRGRRSARGCRATAKRWRSTAASGCSRSGPRSARAPGLYTLLFKSVPVFSLLRAPGRTGLIVALVLALFAALRRPRAAAPVPRSARRAGRGVACCAAALLELNGAADSTGATRRPISPVYDVLARMPRGAVAEFPFYERRIDFHLHTIYMVNSTRHWQPLLNGYSDYIPPDFRELAVTLASFPSPRELRGAEAAPHALHRDPPGSLRRADGAADRGPPAGRTCRICGRSRPTSACGFSRSWPGRRN